MNDHAKAIDADHFAKAPIREAILNIAVELLSADLGIFDQLRSRVSDSYPYVEKLFELRAEIQSGELPDVVTTRAQTGFSFRSKDKKNLFQTRLNGFSFHRLAPYERWETFRDEAWRVWQLYREIAKPTRIASLNVRYINVLQFPVGSELRNFLRVHPEVSDGLPQNVVGYVLRMDMALDDVPNGILVIQQVMEPGKSEMSSVILDLEFRLPFTGTSEEDLWNQIDGIRPRKNKAFLDCITAQMKERII